LARSTSVRASSRPDRSATSASSATVSAKRASAISTVGHQVLLLERLDEVGHRPGLAGARHQVALAERGEDDDGRDPRGHDLLRRRDAVQHRHLDVEDDEVGAQLAGQPHRGLAVAGLAADREALLLEHLLEVEPDEGLVLGEQHPGAGGAGPAAGRRPGPGRRPAGGCRACGHLRPGGRRATLPPA
jgi:hypothetical protein